MCAKRWFLLKCLIFGVYISVTGADVLLQTSDGQKTYVKGSYVEIVCTITPYNNQMTWYVENDAYALCFLGKCTPYSNKPYTFTFTFNEIGGVFKLAINSVNSSHADLLYACDDGTVRKDISFNVTTVTGEDNNDNEDNTFARNVALGTFGALFFCCICAFVLHCCLKKKGTPTQVTADMTIIRRSNNIFNVQSTSASKVEPEFEYAEDYCLNKKGTPTQVTADMTIRGANNIFNVRSTSASKVDPEFKCAEGNHVKSKLTKPLAVKTLDRMLPIYKSKKKHEKIDGEDEIFCDNCKARGKSYAAHAYCLSDEVYICTKCLNKSHKLCVLLWNTGDIAGKDHKLCCNEHYKLEDLMLEGVCQDCNKFICSKCMEKHKNHISTRHQQLHETWSHDNRKTLNKLDLSNETKICRGCRSHPTECMYVHSNIIVCADCFEKGRLNDYDVTKKIREGQKPCQIHGVLGKRRQLPVEAFCFVCNLYMCVGCFKNHRRVYDYWSKNLEGNLFYCSYCEGDEMFPIVCFDLLSRGFKCAKCFQFGIQASKQCSLPEEVSEIFGKITRDADHFQCDQDRSKDKRIPCKSEVYCLVCKLIMCRTCFNSHT